MAATGTILIAEDEDAIRIALAETLRAEGFTVHEAHDGEEGLGMALEIKPDIILLDILMPKKDGMTMLKELRAEEAGKNTCIILLTNVSDPEEITETFYFNDTVLDGPENRDDLKFKLEKRGQNKIAVFFDGVVDPHACDLFVKSETEMREVVNIVTKRLADGCAC